MLRQDIIAVICAAIVIRIICKKQTVPDGLVFLQLEICRDLSIHFRRFRNEFAVFPILIRTVFIILESAIVRNMDIVRQLRQVRIGKYPAVIRISRR